ncbi:MAG: hypothetical protein PHI97_29940 [Desulfobulbus sp.]|nr:hypothetical protein [Desulfobulbus sp.]
MQKTPIASLGRVLFVLAVVVLPEVGMAATPAVDEYLDWVIT